MITLTWQDGDNPVEPYVISDEVLASLEKYRLSLTVPQQTGDGSWASLPKYATIKDLVVGTLTDALVRPALNMFPPTTLAAALEQARAAQAALEEAKASAVQSVLVPPAQ